MKNLKHFILISFLLLSPNLSTVISVNTGNITDLKAEKNYDTDSINQIPKDKATAGLPVVITPEKVQIKSAPVAFIISGDGGWYKFEQSIADKIAEDGIPTIGLDTKKYFWHRRTPEETTSDIIACLEHYGGEWGKEEFIIIGYSLGAEIVPFVVNRFPEAMKSKISMLVLLSPAQTTDFEVHIADMVGIVNRKNTYKVIDEIMRIKDIPSLLIFGADEKSKVPELFKGTPVMTEIIPGDHHYKFNTSLIVQTMKNHKAF